MSDISWKYTVLAEARLELIGCNFAKKGFLDEGVFNFFIYSTGRAIFKNILLYPSSIFMHILIVILIQFFFSEELK